MLNIIEMCNDELLKKLCSLYAGTIGEVCYACRLVSQVASYNIPTKSIQTCFSCILYWALKANLWNFMFVINSKFCCGVRQDGLYAFGSGS